MPSVARKILIRSLADAHSRTNENRTNVWEVENPACSYIGNENTVFRRDI